MKAVTRAVLLLAMVLSLVQNGTESCCFCLPAEECELVDIFEGLECAES